MEHTTYAGRLRYLDADDMDDAVVDYDGLDVYGSDGHKIGNVEGFIIDAEARRVNYIVIGSGSWFTSRQLLLPIGHASLGVDRKSLQTDVTRDALRRLPEYDADQFRQFTDEELRAFERNTVVACCPDEPLEDVSVMTWGYDSRRHYMQPEWWKNVRYASDRLRPVDSSTHGTTSGAAPDRAAATSPASERATENRDLVMASDDRYSGHSAVRTGRSPDDLEGRLREDSRFGEPRPSPGADQAGAEARWAQPGDVLGIETGGERSTAIGNTAEEENGRKRSAERVLVDDDEPRQSER